VAPGVPRLLTRSRGFGSRYGAGSKRDRTARSPRRSGSRSELRESVLWRGQKRAAPSETERRTARTCPGPPTAVRRERVSPGRQRSPAGSASGPGRRQGRSGVRSSRPGPPPWSLPFPTAFTLARPGRRRNRSPIADCAVDPRTCCWWYGRSRPDAFGVSRLEGRYQPAPATARMQHRGWGAVRGSSGDPSRRPIRETSAAATPFRHPGRDIRRGRSGGRPSGRVAREPGTSPSARPPFAGRRRSR